MQIPSSPDSANILIRPGVLEETMFSSFLHPLTSKMGTGEREKALAEQINGKFYLFRRGNPTLCIVCR